MADKSFHLEIITPRRIIFKGEVTSISAPGTDGGFQVLHSHAPMLASLKIGEVKLKENDGKESHFAISGGFFEVRNNSAILLAETVERTGEIDIDRAKSARSRAQKRLAVKGKDIDVERAKLSFLRASNRLKIAGID